MCCPVCNLFDFCKNKNESCCEKCKYFDSCMAMTKEDKREKIIYNKKLKKKK
ncbi:MAG: hypothetical protein N2323_00595 [candidate division WOR-3 bacterium]|nr:hypothetical protein [candidate division WOR-3 bacterium]MCX7836443.1 hypothetical protein [candidate division WOR-3 bacterium]MDW8114211.1 hypothetical protein [candidate division WOR-3 bacterium]